jgi:hypothetical protein
MPARNLKPLPEASEYKIILNNSKLWERSMNTYIVDSCTKENKAVRIIYRCTKEETLKNSDAYVGNKVRIAQWLAASSDPLPNTFGKVQIMVITVPKGCYNAG